jgi:TRAP-type mannitol/chloroaromatic compound transport system permease small subunit
MNLALPPGQIGLGAVFELDTLRRSGMPRAVANYVKNIDFFVAHMWLGLRWATIAIVSILAYAVIMRHGLGTPSIVAYELSMFTMTAGFLLAGGPLLLQEEHVRMDAFYNRWSPRKRAVMDAATFGLFVYIVIMIITAITGTMTSYMEGQHTKSLWGPPLWPFKIFIAAGSTILLLQAISNLIKDIATIRGKSLP